MRTNNTLLYYLNGMVNISIPKSLLKYQPQKFQKALESYAETFGEERFKQRFEYYFRAKKPINISEETQKISDISLKNTGSRYYFDFMEYARFFPQDARVACLFGDITHVPDNPAIVKSRPVANSANSILFKLDKLRHFDFVNDKKPYQKKQDKLVWRGAVYQPHRIAFMNKFFAKSDLMDVAQHNKSGDLNPQWQQPYLSRDAQLDYKFILSIEGNDTATNLKWIMSSNSLCFMTKPRFETWFMEGSLIAGVHYVEVEDDYSNLEERIRYYLDHPDEAANIIGNANVYVSQFTYNHIEDFLSLKILDQYLRYSNQLN